MKSKFLKMAVVALGALAFVNCSSETNPVDPNTNSEISSGSVGELPDDPALGNSSDSQGVGDQGNPANPDVPVSSASEPAAVSSSTVDTNTPVASSSSVAPQEPVSSSSVAPAVASSSSVAPVASSSSVAPQEAPKGIFLANDTDENKNYMEVVYQTKTGDNGGGVLAYPKNLSTTQKHGVVLWGPGGGTEPTAYEGIIRRLASHGFVVIATSESPDGMDRGKPALDWLAKKNETPGDPLYQKLDMTKVGASGHS
ncbi:MAG: alpha/beta hydrolase, partial [Fibrobacter sp.]|nr:alpha/beta hydrolase [Fibrobacter sp.]